MKTQLLILFTLWLNVVYGQVTLNSSPYMQDFNAGTLPIGWSVRTGATGISVGTNVAFNAAQTSWTSATGNFRNVASSTNLKSASTTSEQNASANRALGVRQTGTFGDPGAAFVLQLSNTAGWANFVLRFKLQSLDGSTPGRTITWKVDYGIGSSPALFTTVSGSPSTTTTTLGPATWGSQDVEINFTDLLDDQMSNVWIRIVTLTASAGTGSRPTSAIDDVELSFTPADKTAPTFSAGPTISNIKPTSIDLAATLDEDGSLYDVILTASDLPPSAGQVRLGQNGAGIQMPISQQGVMAVFAGQNSSSTQSGLRAATDYKIYLVAEDKHHNLQSTVTPLAFRTPDPPDLQAPVIDAGFPILNLIDTDQSQFSVSFDEPASFHSITMEAGAVAPDVAQLLAQPTVSITHAHELVQVKCSGLIPGKPYVTWWLAEDHFGNISAIKQLQFTTGNRYIENFDAPESAWSFDRISLTGDQDWANNYWIAGNGSAMIDGFDGKATANEDWLLSPVLQVADHASLSFYSRYAFSGNPLALRLSTVPEATVGGADWVDITYEGPTTATPINSSSASDWTKSLVDLTAYAGKALRLAFAYTSTISGARASALDSIRMDNVTPGYIQVSEDNLALKDLRPKRLTWLSVGLTNAILIKASTGFQVSSDSLTYNDTLVVAQSLMPRHLWIKRKFSSPVEISGDVVFRSGAVTRTVHLASGLMNETWDVATFNLEFFGTNVRNTAGQEFGPIKDTLQIRNVARVIDRLGSDLIAVQEVSDFVALDSLIKMLPRYKAILSNRWSHSLDPPDPNFPPQQIGFIYDTTSVEMVTARTMFSQLHDDIRSGKVTLPGYPGGSTAFWSSGRLPFRATISVKAFNESRTIHLINMHAKSGATKSDHDRRRYDAGILYDSIRVYYANQSVVLLGDFNDEIDHSITPGAGSPYQLFLDDTVHFAVLTRTITGYSYPSTRGFIDHIIVSKDLLPWCLAGSIRTEDARKYVTNYTSTTSDHLPVTARFMFVPQTQTITVPSVPPITYGDRPFRMKVIASSGLPVTITSLDTTRLIFRHDSLFVRGAGSVRLRFSQSGTRLYTAAETIEMAVHITQASQRLEVPPIPDKTMGDMDFKVPGLTTSGLKMLMSAMTSNVEIMSDNSVHLKEAGLATITFSQPGDNNYFPAAPVMLTFCVRPAPPKITLQTGLAPEFVLTSSAVIGNQWYFRGTPISGATEPKLITHVPGVYSVQVAVANCVSEFSGEVILVINDIETLSPVSVYPNPASDLVRVTGLDEIFDICDMSGKIWRAELTSDGPAKMIRIDALPPGTYAIVGMVRDVLRVVRFTRSPD